MTAHEIAEKTGISYVTVQKYLNNLLKQKILIEMEGEDGKKRARKK